MLWEVRIVVAIVAEGLWHGVTIYVPNVKQNKVKNIFGDI